MAKKITLNKILIVLNAKTGGIASLSSDETGPIIKAPATAAGLLNVAYPVPAFVPMRLGAEFSDADIATDEKGVTIRWSRLGASRGNFHLPRGKVQAEVRISEAPDGKSLILKSRIENNSKAQIPQVFFPDLHGLQPLGEPGKTQLRAAQQSVTAFSPYVEPSFAGFYADMGLGSYTASASGPYGLRRAYMTGPKGGFALYWKDSVPQTAPQRFFTQRLASSPMAMRLMWEHHVTIDPGQTWESGEFVLTPFAGNWGNGTAGVKEVTFNGLTISVDEQTGNVLRLAHAATGIMLEPAPEAAGLLKLAFDLPKSKEDIEKDRTTFHLSTQFTKATIAEGKDELKIAWPSLMKLDGKPFGADVSADIRLRPSEDGRSVILSGRVTNNSTETISSVCFPDLRGFIPFHGADRTALHLANHAALPFQTPGSITFHPGGYYVQNMLRWMDVGSLQGGLSMFQRKWQTPDRPSFITERATDANAPLDIAWEHPAQIKPGETWESGDIYLTPHRGGWAKGIEPFREYVRQVNPPRPIPTHVRDGLGFQTVWMMQAMEMDPAKAAFKYKDLPRIAQDTKDHGLDELCLWGWCHYFDLPVVARKELGGREAFLKAVQKCREIGVHVSPFVSVQFVQKPERYGLAAGAGGWDYHPDLYPAMDPYYIHAPYPVIFWKWAGIPNTNEAWRKDVLSTLGDWIDAGSPSFAWDVFGLQTKSMDDLSVYAQLREKARGKDPESVFAAESTDNMEFDNQFLDYTWNWGGTYLAAPMMNVLPVPRLNYCLDDDPRGARKCFCEGLYMNLVPRKIDQPNGTALLSEKPELSATVKRLAALRKQFLPFFAEGLPLGDSVLSNTCESFVRGWQMESRKKLLIIVLNENYLEKPVSIQSDLDLWLAASPKFITERYDEMGKLLETSESAGSHWSGATQSLNPYEIALFVIRPSEAR